MSLWFEKETGFIRYEQSYTDRTTKERIFENKYITKGIANGNAFQWYNQRPDDKIPENRKVYETIKGKDEIYLSLMSGD
jgi:hypothetical protein